jgi:signal transduction histidine kinase/CheY-like chemotaxis protein
MITKISNLIIKLYNIVAGNSNDFDLRHRIFNVSCIAAAFIGLTGTTINLLLDLDLITTLSTIVLFFFFITIYVISYKYKVYKILLPIYIPLIMSIIIILWFTNDGSFGPTTFAFILVGFVFNIITENITKKIINILLYFSLFSLFMIEIHFPELIHKYPSNEIRFYDYFSTVMFEMLVMLLITSYFIKSFFEDKKLTELQRDEIQNKNKEIELTKQELLLHKENLEELVDKRTEELKNSKIKAEKSDKLKTAFLSNMSHEIRTPMNAIIGLSELLKIKDIDDDKKEEYLDVILNKSQLLLKLINDVLDIAKIEANEINISQDNCNINKIFKDLNDTYAKDTEQKNTEFKCKCINKDIIVITDEYRIKQIFYNLISNAIKFTEKGIIEISLSIETINDKEMLEFCVSDTGIGIPKDKIEVIFERFRQINETDSKDFGGTGLGLAISKKLVNILGGEIWVESKINTGSNFYFTIPFTKSEENKIAEYKQLNLNNYNWQGKKILIAEDEEFNFIILNELLEPTKIEIIRAFDGQQVLDILENDNNFNLILLDIQMPKISGYDLCPIIKTKYPNLKIIAQTAYVMSEDIEKMISIGFDKVITKPIDFEDFLSDINTYLKN